RTTHTDARGIRPRSPRTRDAHARVRHRASSSITMTATDTALSWKQADIDVLVATRDGEFAGFIEFDDGAHLVRDHHGTELGAFVSLDEARRALEARHVAPRARAGTGSRRFGRRMRRARV